MSFWMLWVVFSVAIIDWVAVIYQRKSLRYIAKPAVIFALLAWLWGISGFRDPLVWFALGLLFSLVGDVLLVLPRERFIGAWASFLLTHLAYIIGFNPSLPPINVVNLTLALLVIATAIQVYRRLAEGLRRRGDDKLKVPVIVYTTAISVMVLSALLTLVRPDNEWRAFPSLLVSGGALLFFISDTILAWNRYVARLPNNRIKVIITYHLGQIAIIAGAAINYRS